MPPAAWLGPIPLRYFDRYELGGHETLLGGWSLTAVDREELRELCADADTAVAYELASGGLVIEDPSESHMLIQYCTFTENQFYTGFYIINSWNYSPLVGWPNFYPWSLTMTFIGTRGELLEAYDVGYIGEQENDWE